MKIPKKLHICGHDYKVLKKDIAEGGSKLGYCNNSLLEIGIHNELLPTKEAQVFLHEIIHTTDALMDTKLKESQVWRLANALYAVIKDNNLRFDK